MWIEALRERKCVCINFASSVLPQPRPPAPSAIFPLKGLRWWIFCVIKSLVCASEFQSLEHEPSAKLWRTPFCAHLNLSCRNFDAKTRCVSFCRSISYNSKCRVYDDDDVGRRLQRVYFMAVWICMDISSLPRLLSLLLHAL